MLDKMYATMIEDAYITEQAGNRIKFFEYPATAKFKEPHIILDEIGPPMATVFGDDEEVIYEQMVQVDVWTTDRILTRNIANKIRDVLRAESITQSSVGPSDYDEGIFRDARRYTYKYYRSEL